MRVHQPLRCQSISLPPNNSNRLCKVCIGTHKPVPKAVQPATNTNSTIVVIIITTTTTTTIIIVIIVIVIVIIIVIGDVSLCPLGRLFAAGTAALAFVRSHVRGEENPARSLQDRAQGGGKGGRLIGMEMERECACVCVCVREAGQATHMAFTHNETQHHT